MICPLMSKPVEQITTCMGVESRSVKTELVSCEKLNCALWVEGAESCCLRAIGGR